MLSRFLGWLTCSLLCLLVLLLAFGDGLPPRDGGIAGQNDGKPEGVSGGDGLMQDESDEVRRAGGRPVGGR